MNRPGWRSMTVVCLAAVAVACGETDAQTEGAQDWQEAIDRALPRSPTAEPAAPRSLLIFNLSKGYVHESIGWVDYAIRRMGEVSDAFSAVVSSDTLLFQADRLAEFDAVLFNNNTGEPFSDPALRASLQAFVRGGGGVIGLHAATDGFFEWPEFGELMGGYFVRIGNPNAVFASAEA